MKIGSILAVNQRELVDRFKGWIQLGAVRFAQARRIGDVRGGGLTSVKRDYNSSIYEAVCKEKFLTYEDYVNHVHDLFAPVFKNLDKCALQEGHLETEKKFLIQMGYIDASIPGNYAMFYDATNFDGPALGDSPNNRLSKIPVTEQWKFLPDKLMPILLDASKAHPHTLKYKTGTFYSSVPPIDSKKSADAIILAAYIDWVKILENFLFNDKRVQLHINAIIESIWAWDVNKWDKLTRGTPDIIVDALSDFLSLHRGIAKDDSMFLAKIATYIKILLRAQDPKKKKRSGLQMVSIGMDNNVEATFAEQHLPISPRVVGAPNAHFNFMMRGSQTIWNNIKHNAKDLSSPYYRNIRDDFQDIANKGNVIKGMTDSDYTNHDHHIGMNITFMYAYLEQRLMVEHKVEKKLSFLAVLADNLFTCVPSITYADANDDYSVFGLWMNYGLRSGTWNTGHKGNVANILFHGHAAVIQGIGCECISWFTGKSPLVNGTMEGDTIRILVSSDDTLTFAISDKGARNIDKIYEYMIDDKKEGIFNYKMKKENTTVFLRYNYDIQPGKKVAAYGIISSRILTLFRREHKQMQIFPNLCALLNMVLDCRESPAWRAYKELFDMIGDVIFPEYKWVFEVSLDNYIEVIESFIVGEIFQGLQTDYIMYLELSMSPAAAKRKMQNAVPFNFFNIYINEGDEADPDEDEEGIGSFDINKTMVEPLTHTAEQVHNLLFPGLQKRAQDTKLI